MLRVQTTTTSLTLVLPWKMVDNSRTLCISLLGRCFRQWVIRTGHLTLA